jgi:hypothetical protein
MKKNLPLIFFIFCNFIYTVSSSQYVTIPDANFRSWLSSHGFASCMSGTMLDTTCTPVVTTRRLDLQNSYFTNLFGVQFFDSLDTLICNNTSYTTMTIPALPPSLKWFDCHSNWLNTVPALPSGLTYFNCAWNTQLSSLPALPNSITEIQCWNCNLSTLPALPSSLITLWCWGNNITNLPSLPSQLQSLWCNDNNLTFLPSLPSSLRDLICSYNSISWLPSLPSNLQYLICSHNSISYLPVLPSTLVRLFCQNNQINYLPPPLPAALQQFNCEYNQLTYMPALPSGLTSLWCSHNQINNFYNGNLPYNLYELYCDYNQLSYLPGINYYLTRLSAKANRLSSIYYSVIPLYLNYINVDSNLFTTLPPQYSSGYFSCNYNQISSLGNWMPGYREFYCNHNQLTSLPSAGNSNLPGVKWDFSYNQISDISNMQWMPDSLRYLNLSNNPITCLTNINILDTLIWNNTGIQCRPDSTTIYYASPSLSSLASCRASVSISANPAGTVCTGTSVTFTATSPYGGPLPSYQWKKNNVNVGTGNTYTDATLVNGDIILSEMTSNGACVTGNPATSNSISMSVNSTPVTPSVSIMANPSGAVCSSTSVTFTATPVNGGNSPTYLWKKNNVNVGTGTTYTNASWTNGDNVICEMTSNAVCVVGNPAVSNAITMSVNPNVVPAVSIAASPAGAVCSGTPVTFTAAPVNGGSNPTYQWRKNNSLIGTGNPFTTSSFSNNDNITCVMTSNAACVSVNPVTSNSLQMAVSSPPSAPAVPSGYIFICRGTTGNTYSIPLITGANSYTWIAPTGAAITSGQGTNSVTLSFSSQQTSGNLCVYASNSCGNSIIVYKYLNVTTSRPPTPTSISGPAASCPATSASYSCPNTYSANFYTWTAPSNATIASGQGTNSVVVNFSSAFTGGTIKVTAGNCIGNSNARSMTITSIPGTPGNISGPNQACTNQTVAYSINAVSGATTYLWTAPAGSTIASGQGTTSVTVTFGTSSGTLSVRAGNACGYGNPKNKSITVNCTQRPELSTAAEAQHATLYPNPATENVTVTFNTSQASQYTIRLIDMTGRIIFSEKGKSAEGSNRLEFGVADYAKGVYCFILEQEGTPIITQRLIIE